MKIMLDKDDMLSASYLRYRDLLEASDKYDVIIDKQTAKKVGFDQFKRVMIIERKDAAAIWMKQFLIMDNVKCALEMFHYKDLEVNNRPATGGRIFVDEPSHALPQRFPIEQKHLDKVQAGFSFFHNPRFDGFFEEIEDVELIPTKDREIDLMYAGTTSFGTNEAGQWITRHRQRCIENINAMDGELRVLAVDGRGLPRAEYYQSLQQAKVFLSPFGTGEYCGKDFEALMCGCIVVKPRLPARCYFNPDYYNDIVYCANFDSFGLSDYEDAIAMFGDRPPEEVKWKLLEAEKNERKIVEDILA